MNIADLIDDLQQSLNGDGFGLYENEGGCAISALYFAKHLTRLKVSHRIVYFSSSYDHCYHAVVRIPFGKTYAYLDSEGIYNRKRITGEMNGRSETIYSKKFVQEDINDKGQWNSTFDRANVPKLYTAIDEVFEQVGV